MPSKDSLEEMLKILKNSTLNPFLNMLEKNYQSLNHYTNIKIAAKKEEEMFKELAIHCYI